MQCGAIIITIYVVGVLAFWFLNHVLLEMEHRWGIKDEMALILVVLFWPLSFSFIGSFLMICGANKAMHYFARGFTRQIQKFTR